METTHGMEFEDHLAAIETIVRRLERGDMRLNEALEAFRTACHHVRESEMLLEVAAEEVRELTATLRPERDADEAGLLSDDR